MRKPLVVTAIDFSKAFDSVNRAKLIEALIKFKFHPTAIDVIVSIYENDSTDIHLGDNKITQIEVTSGIRQGCNGSTVLFLLITYLIIEEISKSGIGFKNHLFYIPGLFFADDGLQLSHSVEEARKGLECMRSIAKKYGLDLNDKKSKIIIYNMENQPKEIAGIEVANKISYLGVTITNARKCFKEHRASSINKAQKFAAMLPATIARSTSRLLIGKTYWKNIVMPSILYGSEVMLYTDTETKRLQTAENRAWRYILQAPGHATNASLRSEIGASSQKYRDMKSKLLFAKHLTENQFTNQLFNDSMIFHHTGWSGQMKKYLKEANIHPESLQNISVKQITDKVNSLDKAAWEKEIHSKSTLSLYSSLKTEIRHEEHIYDNSEASRILFEARTNWLRLGWREEFKGNSTSCPLCQHRKEDLLHFLSK